MSYRKIKDGSAYSVLIDTYYCDTEADIENLNTDEVSSNAEWEKNGNVYIIKIIESV